MPRHQDKSSISAPQHEQNHPVQKQEEHLGASRQYWRDIILGVNDGLVSTFLLVAGVAGGGLLSRDILLTAIAGAVAGAVSMAAGEYVATKSQNEVLMVRTIFYLYFKTYCIAMCARLGSYSILNTAPTQGFHALTIEPSIHQIQGEIELERKHVENSLDREMTELDNLFPKIGITNENNIHVGIQHTMKEFYRQNPGSLLKLMEALEFGVVEDEARTPLVASLLSFGLFVVGSLPSVIPFFFSKDPKHGLIAAGISTTTALLAVGALKTWATRGKCLIAAFENLVIAGCGGALAYGVGVIFDTIIR